MSTRRLDDNMAKLPELRASAQRFSRFQTSPNVNGIEEPDYAINTSAIGRAFPEFSQSGTSTEHSSISIEIARGAPRNGADNRFASHQFSAAFEGDSLDLSVPMIGEYEVTGTPPLKPQRLPRTEGSEAQRWVDKQVPIRASSNLRHETQDFAAQAKKTKDYSSEESAKGSGDHGRGLAAMHARVNNDGNLSHLSNNRPPTIDLTTKQTRFGNSRTFDVPTAGTAVPTRFSSTHGLVQGTPRNKSEKINKHHTANHGTQQSFLLPDMPNISELISGVYEDGTPVFSRHSKSKSSRFPRSRLSKQANFVPVEEISVPEDEQAIFLSLKVLQDKISLLEKGNAEAQGIIEDLRQKNGALQTTEQRRSRLPNRSDSALGTTDSEGVEDVGVMRRDEIENNRKFSHPYNRLLLMFLGLRSSVRDLQASLDAAVRRSNTTETILRNITQERDSAVSQLSVAYVTIEQLKAEVEDLQSRLRQEPVTMSFPNLASASAETHKSTKTTHTAKKDHPISAVRAFENEDDSRLFKNVETGASSRQAIPANAKAVSQKSTHKTRANHEDTRRFVKGISREQMRSEPPTGNKASALEPEIEASKDLTYLSFLDSGEVAKLRRTLEQERVEQKRNKAKSKHVMRSTDAVNEDSNDNYQRKPVDLTRASFEQMISKPGTHQANHDEFQASQRDIEQPRRHSEGSLISTRSRRRDIDSKNLTSAFIVPDITIKASLGDAQPSKTAVRGSEMSPVDYIVPHSVETCVVCNRKADPSGRCKHQDASHRVVKVSKPVPVSQRRQSLAIPEGEPTIRPSQPPAIALAVVIKALEDEIVHLKIELTKNQSLYNRHDPALSMRRRKSLYQQTQTLVEAIDIKSDQIYALYDVLEGQKQDGHEMSEQEVEVTIQSLGIDAAGLGLRGGGSDDEEEVDSVNSKSGFTEKGPWDLDVEDESDNDLPWEGIETTFETTTQGLLTVNRPASAVA